MVIQRLLKINFIIFSAFLFCSCSNTEQKNTEKTLRLNYLSDANSLDPRFGYEIPANHTVKMLFEGLMRHSADGALVYGACESYEISADGKTYIFHLRDSKWSNGEPVVAQNFEWAWKSILDPSLPTQGTADFYPIKNAQKIAKGELPVNEAGVRAVDDKTLIVELEFPAPYFLALTATSAFSPFKEECGHCSELVSNGPFRLVSWKPQDSILLEKNPFYWNKQNVFFEKIEVSIIPDAATQLALYEKNETDWFGKPLSKLSLDAVPHLRANNQLNIFPERAVYWYFLNTEKYPLNNLKLRKALSLAVNRKEIVSHVLKEDEDLALSVNRGHDFFRDADIDEAVSLFDDALEELSLARENFPSLKLSYCGIETNCRIAAAVQEMWQKTFGIKIELDPQEWTCYYDKLCTGDFLIGGMSWHSRISDPIYNLQLFQFKEDRLNMSNWENVQFQKIVSQAQQEPDENLRQALLTKAEEILIDEMPIIPIYFLSISYAKNFALQNVFVSEINEIDFAFAHK